MQGFTTNYVNLIADNLRDRYDNGFPILKELIQNADDARAQGFLFASHPGFPEAAHPLLKGPGLWFFNDGEFKDSDARALRSFGINTKAGDATAIGKFGLGMKSVFHLCEAIFYVAWDGAQSHRAGLTPWKQEDNNPHPEWEESHEADWQRLEDLARKHAADSQRTWFLLWVPLRRRDHLRGGNGATTGAIISRFPGDDLAELEFLDREELALDLAEILPLLRHLERIEHRGNGNAFALRLKTEQRLLGPGLGVEAAGEVLVGNDRRLLRFGGRRAVLDLDGPFADLKAREEWPRSGYRDENGHERQAEDKTSPDGAVLLCAGSAPPSRSNLHWAVFLPVEQGGERLKLAGGDIGHSLILHGQFFIDAGRKKVHGLDALHQNPDAIGEGRIDDGLLRRTWNQHLAQRVLLPLVIPALEHYVDSIQLADADCGGLTQALGNSQWFRDFRAHVCGSDAWVRVLEPSTKPAWRRVQGNDRDRLRPMPSPPKSAPERPWQVFPRLADCDIMPFDGGAACLSDRPYQWQEAELHRLLADVAGLFTDGPRMEYLGDFLDDDHGALPYLSTEALQVRLIRVWRQGLHQVGAEHRRQQAEKSRRLIGFIEPGRRLTLTADLQEPVLRGLWEIDAPILLVPKGIEPTPVGSAVPENDTLRAWLGVLDRSISAEGQENNQKAVLDAVQSLLKTMDPEARGRFLRVHKDLRVIAVRDARTGRNRAVSFAQVQALREAGTLFGFIGLGEAGLGLSRLLAGVLPEANICLVQARTYRELFPGELDLPGADKGQACLVALGKDGSRRLGGIQERRALLAEANDSGSDAGALRGLRYLLHGCPTHQADDDATLWIPGNNQHSAWSKLWGQICGEGAAWSLLDSTMADTIPRGRWSQARVREIEPDALLNELQRTLQGICDAGAFSVEERDEILSRIDDQALWERLPLHTTVSGEPVPASGEGVYLGPEGDRSDDPLIGEATLITHSNNPAVGDKQRKWLKPLDDRARIEIALGTAEPALHWRTILDALARLPSDIDSDLVERLRGIAWAPTRHGEPVKPEDVIELAGGLRDAAQRLVAEHRAAHEPCFAVPEDLDGGLRAHAAWSKLGVGVLSSGEAGLERLGLLIGDLPCYHIGPWPTGPTQEALDLLARCDHLPGWRLLRQASDPPFSLDMAWQQLRPGLVQPMEPERLLNALDWLSGETADWQVRKSAFDTYLSQFTAQAGLAKSHFAGLHLASQDRKWLPPAELCAGAHGVDLSRLLDQNQMHILGDLIRRSDRRPAEPPADAAEVFAAGFEMTLSATAENLRNYFRPWDGGPVPAPMIGVVLGLLGRGTRALARDYLRPHSFEFLLQQIPWVDPRSDANRRDLWMGGQAAAQALDLIESAVTVADGDQVDVPNLVGTQIQVPLEREVRTLLAGALSWKGGYRVLIPIRRVDPTLLGPDPLSGLLRATAERLYADLYNQKSPDFGALWQQLDRSDQLEIGAARNMILDYLPWYLRQLALDGAALKEALKEALNDWDSQRLKVEEARAARRDESAQRTGLHKALEGLHKALEVVAKCVVKDPTSQQRVLAGVKAKLKQFQYDAASIPFELFQNADDAAVELGQIEAHPLPGCEVPPAARRLVVETDDDGLRFLHWGRPINARGPVGFGGERRGYGRDLEKMLILSASDKQSDQGVTGKFGLGFKSVLLACDRPRVLSGRLAVEVVAGILPQPWEDSQAARDSLLRHAEGDRQTGTLIELPKVTAPQAEILGRFKRLAGVLCIFGQKIRSITLCQSADKASGDGHEAYAIDVGRQVFTWEPTELCPGVERGRLNLKGDWGTETYALCLRTGNGDVLLALGPQGFRALPNEVPTLWVTAPMREKAALSFAVNGRFDLDAGRARLAGNSQNNRELGQRIGAEAGDALGGLFELTRADWDAVRDGLGLVADLALHDFWHGIWVGLTTSWLKRQGDAAVDLARGVALALLKRLSERTGAVPNGLAVPLQTLVSTHAVRYELPKALAAPPVLEVLGSWDRFTTRYPKEGLVSEGMSAILKHAKLAGPVSLGLPALVTLIGSPQVKAEDARVLGKVLLLTEDDPVWASDDLKRRLKELQFRTAAGTWVDGKKLLTQKAAPDEKDEPLRYNLAPDERRLHPDYYADEDEDDSTPGMTFFLACRERLQAPAEDLAKWVLAASAPAQQQVALVYLADGALGEQVAALVRSQRWLQDVFQDPVLMAGLSAEQEEKLQRRLASKVQLARAWQPNEPIWAPQPVHPGIDLVAALDRIHAWWSKEGLAIAARYRERIYPAGTLDLREDPETGLDRSSWLTLFALGTFQGMGPREEQHRGFIQHCQTRGWWKTFAEIDPKQQPDKWMEIIEEYAEAQHDDEEWIQWIAQFPKLYRLRRWMDDYVELFRSIDRFTENEPFSLNTLLTPRANRHFQGGGIDAPPLNRTLKVGAHLVVRELLHHEIIGSPLAIPYAYAPIERIRNLFQGLDVDVETSQDIHRILTTHLGTERATFGGAYDIPLRLVAVDDGLLSKILYAG